MKKNKKISFKDLFLYTTFGLTIFFSCVILLSFFNICYLPINTTGQCIIARNIIGMEYFLIFLIIETIFSIVVTILYLLDGFKFKIKRYKIVGITNILLQPFVVIALISILG